MKLSELLSALPFGFPPPDADPDITAPVTEDSREVRPGGVFVARRGRGVDGHQYIDKAIEAGAAAVFGEEPDLKLPVAYVYTNDAGQALGHLASAYYGYPSRSLVVIGVTGTDGKTTTSNVAYHILKTAGVKVGMISTVSAIIGEEEIPTGLHVTTPPAHEIHRYLKQMVDAGLTHCVLEVTSHGLDQGRVNGVDFDVAVMTNITHEHLDWHGSFEAYRDAKAKLFRITAGHPPRGSQPTITIINVDDPSATYFAQASIGANYMLLYSLHDQSADFYADRIHYRPNGASFMLRGNAGDIAINSPLVGEFNIYNLIAGAAAAISAMPQPVHQQRMLHAVPMGIQSLPQVPGRMEAIDEGQDFLAVVDFAHTPNALKQALKAARTMISKENRVIAVFGSAGLRDVEKRRLMAEVSTELADISIFTAEDPRTESLAGILDVMAHAASSKGGVEGQTFFRVRDRGRALYEACQLAKPGDIVIACGKGHEQSMCFGRIEHPWDDRNALRAALRQQPLQSLPTADPGRDANEQWVNE
ncbi:MAG: UDP-N-acetylmuramoyl-L-alanyl-D-glutamate--2,6-diaminopimelate ligase [Anaerolineae bacterium]|nr:UDP-N-acetylmuramoyl-L-alanyl-D-glutamate--2,6-diaminopimelate ligase [Anaerolineae bacterium]